MNRSKAREYMMSILYQLDINDDFDVDSKNLYLKEDSGKQSEYCEEIFSLVCNKKDIIDKAIATHCRGWEIGRMPKTDLAILRLAACEVLFVEEVPDSASINEAVELAKKYGEEKSPSYINGILGAISSEKNKDEQQ